MGNKNRIFPRSFEGQSPKEFGLAVNAIKTRRITLDSARTNQEFEMGGSLLWCYNASSVGATATISFGDPSIASDGIIFKQNMMVRGVDFSRLLITNTAQAGEYLDLAYVVEGEGGQNIEIENAASSFTAVTLAKATGFSSATDISLLPTATTLIAPADATRREIFIKNLSTNTQTFRIGDSGAGATDGFPLEPGDGLVITTTGAVYGYNPGAGAESVAVIATTD